MRLVIVSPVICYCNWVYVECVEMYRIACHQWTGACYNCNELLAKETSPLLSVVSDILMAYS